MPVLLSMFHDTTAEQTADGAGRAWQECACLSGETEHLTNRLRVTGTTQATVSAIELGQANPRLTTLASLAEVLDLDVSGLFVDPDRETR